MKRIPALLACLLLLLSVSVSALAQELPYTDAYSIRNIDAVAMLTDLELLEGNHRKEFSPGDYLTRAEVAKIAALVVSSDPTPEAGSPYYDTSKSWARDYISFCYEQGFLAWNDGYFHPDEAVTARELVKMLLGAVGYDLSNMVGKDWDIHLDALANELRIYNGYELDYSQPITRDYAARLILNILSCNAVIGYEGSEPVYLVDELLNPVSVLEHRFGVLRYQQVVTANEYADLENPGAPLEEGKTKLYGHYPMNFSTDLEALGRTVTVYLRDGQPVGVPVYDPEEFFVTVTGQAALDTLLNNGGYYLAEDSKIYDNAVPVESEALHNLSDTDTVSLIDYESDGAIDLVLIYRWESYPVLQSEPLVIRTNDGNQVFPGIAIVPAETIPALQLGDHWVLNLN